MKRKQLNKNSGNNSLPASVHLKKLATTFLMLCAFYSGVQAQITAGFELDGNATAALPNPPDDWDLIYNGTSSAQITTNVVTDADNIFQGGGSKDDLDINNWGWTTGSIPDKDDILHGGVALYNNCQLYFFADRYAVNGSANIGFWLFKDSVSVLPNGTFSGLHTVGDLLIVSEFTNGGGTATINAYQWVGSGGNVNGTLQSVTLNGTNAYAITNTATVTSPWPYLSKTGSTQFEPGAFFEGGVDLCNTPGLDPCFTSFIIETRSSFAIDAVLKDFMNGSFNTSPQIALASVSRCIDGPAVTLSATVTGGVGPLTYSWSPGGNSTSSISVSPTVTTTYTFTATGANGCTKSVVATVSVSPLPDVNAGADKTLDCTTTSVMLNGSSSTQGVTYQWSTIGGNIVSAINTPTVTANVAGTYVLKVTNASGCTATDTAMVTFVGTLPNVNAGSDKTITCTAMQVALNGSSTTPGATFMWTASNGGTIISGGNTATPLVQGSGKYILTITNPANGCTAKDTADVFNDNTIPSVYAGGDMVLNCVVTSLMLDGFSATPGVTIVWTAKNGGNIISGANTFNPIVDKAGTYIITVTHPITGCTAKDSAMVTSNTTVPNVNAGPDMEIGCFITNTVTLHGTSTSNVGFNWTTIGGNIISGGNTAHVTVNATGIYVLRVIDHLNGCIATDTAIVAHDKILGADTTVCGCITLSAYVSGATSYQWCGGGNYPTLKVCQSGTYCVTVSNGICIETDTIVVTVLPPAMVQLGNDTTVITNLVLNAGNAGAMFMWNTGATTQMININSTGQYIVTVTIANGCTDSDTINVTVITGIAENTNRDFDVSIYPNPSKSNGFTLNFNIAEKGNVEIRILNTLGLAVYSEKLENFKGEYLRKIDLKNCAPGMYVAYILKDDLKSTKSIVLSK